MEIIWKPIPNFSRYEASNTGLIRSLNYKNSKKIKVLKPAKSSDGYMKTMLKNDQGKYNSWVVHKWICLAFYGERPEGLEVNHIDGDKTNNHINNLEYVTHSGNCQHSFDTGLQEPKRGSKNGMHKLVESEVAEIRAIAKSRGMYYDRKGLADQFGVSEYCIKDIVTRRRNSWPHVK